ncbi:MAG: hypothetical protein L6R38_003509 [Xanthoria sp. 2 TBL-2021]|nr:MAG: hypothetical protein L6R38_003509 [Xanthoria sp. 2 TBL-2021]
MPLVANWPRPHPLAESWQDTETANSTAFEPTDAPIARLGCSIHQHLPSFRTITHSAFHRSIAKALDYTAPLVTQSQLITKPAHVGSRINPHQDGCSSFTDPPSALTFWYALEDAFIDNGCLLVAPGSHLTEPLKQLLAKGVQDGRPEFIQLRKPVWAKNSVDRGNDVHYRREYEYLPLEVKKGTLILCHGNLMHASGANRSEKGRMASYSTHEAQIVIREILSLDEYGTEDKEDPDETESRKLQVELHGHVFVKQRRVAHRTPWNLRTWGVLPRPYDLRRVDMGREKMRHGEVQEGTPPSQSDVELERGLLMRKEDRRDAENLRSFDDEDVDEWDVGSVVRMLVGLYGRMFD